MLTSKMNSLKSILESAEGIHLTAYLVNRGNLADLKSQLSDVIAQSYEWLNPVMGIDERNEFLEPLDNLLVDARIFNQMKGNIGIFRNKESFRVLNIPTEVEKFCQVATTFHVKPLLRWLQSDREFMILGLDRISAHLYVGSQDTLRLVDSVLFPDFFKRSSSERSGRSDGAFLWLNDWITELTKSSKPKLFIAGEKEIAESLYRNLKYPNTFKAPVGNSFTPQKISEICKSVRAILKNESQHTIEKALLEFLFAEEGNRTRKNIFQIARAVVNGRVRKLIVTDEINIFGKIDLKSGGLAIHPFDLDHEDDDILDDLAQMVLNQGGEVIVASRDEIPKGRPILAILDDDGMALEKSEDVLYDDLQGRFG